MLKQTFVAMGAAALILPAMTIMPAHAQAPTGDLTITGRAADRDTRATMVSVADLDLRVDRDVRKADSRIRTAAASVCGVGRMNGSVIQPHESGCYADAFSRARVDLNGIIADQRQG